MRDLSNLRWRVLAGAALVLMAGGALAGEITFYKDRDFNGDTLTLRRAAPDLEKTGFNDSAASVIVREGMWEVCSDPFYRGNCARLRPGKYDRVASVRELVGVSAAPVVTAPVVTAPVVAAPAVVASAPRIVLYQNPGFSGYGVQIPETQGNLERIH